MPDDRVTSAATLAGRAGGMSLRRAARSTNIEGVSWIFVVGAVGAIGLAFWTWMKRDRSTRDDHGSISDQWRSEQRLKERDISDR